ncbi:rhodanese-related sulfurtransferase [Acinetobacter qingfengensis]|uniref:Sulfurtransferase n=1 Tax=Acinetobacter qingfengensis TaxID=1262585 RepID=A0A1E7QWF6_9GAMM|nr:rhodanese-like domain-containing protein [Acinetobacter qingfengensis]KAA8731315.1 rhodanese-related sulfurtransferase [Acinetobacter qingfengensis]OEY91438.1 sulfurtransferase [Acinetobacter qingfengensis]
MNKVNQSFATIKNKLLKRQEIALVDVREEDLYAKGHPLFAVNIAFSRLEIEILNRIPRLNTDIVLYDNGEGLAQQAYQKLQDLGYQNLSLLEGGVNGWKNAGGELFIDVNSASKAFGEWVEHYKQTPSLSAEEVKQLLEQDDNVVVLDARRFDEYQTMSIPGGISVPGAELVLRAQDIVKDQQTKIIVNCAGRTRSLIGTQSLINAQIPHQIYALRNGTIGWTLARQQLAIQQNKQYQDFPASADRQNILENAKNVAQRAGVRSIDYATLKTLTQEPERTTYLFDVRSEAEYIAAYLPESRWIAGGQLVQETDHYASVRGARIILIDPERIRAYMTGSWLAQMNWEVYVLEDDFSALLTESGVWVPKTPAITINDYLQPAQLNAWLEEGLALTLLDFTTSANYNKGHIATAQWALRKDIATLFGQNKISTDHPVVVTCGSSLLAQYAVAQIQAFTHQPVYVLQGGNAAWKAAGFAIETGQGNLLSEPIDRYKRPYEGTDNSEQAMNDYLEWEYGLVQQLKQDNTHGFFVV